MTTERREKPLMGHVDLVFPTEYVKAADLEGKDRTVVIDRVVLEELVMQGGKREWKPVLSLCSPTGRKLGKRLVCNKTNAKLIAKATGKKRVEEWIGQKITLYPTTTKAKGEVVECIRVRVQVVAQTEDVTEAMAAPPAPRPAFDEEGPEASS